MIRGFPCICTAILICCIVRYILAMKSMLKDAMISKNQVGHIRAERDILTESENPWIVTLYYSFQVGVKL